MRYIYLKIVGFLLSWIVKIWLKTLRYYSSGDLIDQQGVILFLHGHQLGLLLHKPPHPLITPISLSRDGDLQVEIMRRLGIESVRGSRSKGAVSALKSLIKHSHQGKTLLIALDGSRGPYGVPQPGGLFVAYRTQKPVWFCYIDHFKGIRLKTWDRFILPYPFSRVCVHTKKLDLHSMSSLQINRTRSRQLDPCMQEIRHLIKNHHL